MSEQEIMDKLDEIEKKVEHIEHMEEEQISEEKNIETDEKEELSELKQAARKKQFDNIQDWQQYIWENCKYKKEVKESDDLEFYCEKRKGPCKFDGCPENWEDEE